jgi:hypothetical protein
MQPVNKPGPLESLQARGLKDYCEMCGARSDAERDWFEPAFNPDGEPKTLCRDCRIGSSELLSAKREKLEAFVSLVARMKTEEEFADNPDPEDWISTLNELIASARKAVA